jgi:hypothetical protein
VLVGAQFIGRLDGFEWCSTHLLSTRSLSAMVEPSEQTGAAVAKSSSSPACVGRPTRVGLGTGGDSGNHYLGAVDAVKDPVLT